MVPLSWDHNGTSGRDRCRRQRGYAGEGWLRGCCRRSLSLAESVPQCGERGAVVAAEVIALAAIGDGADKHRFMRPEIIARIRLGKFLAEVTVDGIDIENGGGEVANTAPCLVRD